MEITFTDEIVSQQDQIDILALANHELDEVIDTLVNRIIEAEKVIVTMAGLIHTLK